MVIGERAVVDHGGYVGVLVVVRSIVVAVGVCYDGKTWKEKRQQTQQSFIAQAKMLTMPVD